MIADERIAQVARLWKEHTAAAFPPRLRGEEIGGIDMVMLDADVAGCVVTWLQCKGRLDSRRRSIVAACLDQLAAVIPLLTETAEADYYRRLRHLAELIAAT